ncbi:MAG: FAD-binding domain-containing protein [Marinicella sp.]
MNLVWFRNDLRLADNPALFHAIKENNSTLALFLIHPEQHQQHGEAPQKLEFIKAHVKDLCERLKNLNIESLVYEIPTFNDVPEIFEKIFQQLSIDQVFFNANYWLNEVRRDKAVKQFLDQSGVSYQEYHSNYLLPPGTVRKTDGGMYHVFTPYKQKYIEAIKTQYKPPLSIPEPLEKSVGCELESDNLEVDLKLTEWAIGEQHISNKLKSFLQNTDYKELRDYPATKGTSRLSPYFTVGVISARQCLAHALKQYGEDAFHSTWVSELIWRDFYNDLMFEHPKLAKGKAFKADAKDEWLNQPELFQKWQKGETGFPLVDAGMRQLLEEGWMHNRVRMVVASFLSKLCLIDWRLGEAHFMAHLLDGDLASNNGGWQWSSATGCDAAPYFRIFNPTTQSKKFDPDGDYIRKYVPELREVPVKEIHDPRLETCKQCDYPTPVIDYKLARAQALDWFKR